ncbi:MAG: ribosome small subunit-dependent GTPase A [Armatimonadota bacterium]|nr:MAG: ribosome small subunit-dependent GTPase A [Armatimonadota bacterium]
MQHNLLEGTVLENRGALFEVLVQGHVVRCLLRGRLKKDKRRQVAPVAAGDRVKLSLLEPGRGIIEEVLPRASDLSRSAAGSVPLQQTLVANVDQAVIVFAAAEPRADLFMLDRFLVAATGAGLEPVICVNKCDLVDGGPPRARFAVYPQCGFRMVFTSAECGDGLAELKETLRDRRSVLCGPSGVGKSSLLNAIAPGLQLRTRETGDVTHKGRHTTSSISLVELPFGGWVADTPGLRQLGFWEVSPDQVAGAFPDIEPYLGRCRFSSCAHGDEPGCALKAAVNAGDVDARRLKSFLQMGGCR